MKIPLRKRIENVRAKVKSRKETGQVNPDDARIQRELAYISRLGTKNPRVNKLRKQIAERRRRSYGR